MRILLFLTNAFINSITHALGNKPLREWVPNANERELCNWLTGFWYTAGKVQTPLPELLLKYQIPKGVFPKNVLNYEFDETTGKIVVLLPFVCEVRYKDDSIVRFDKRITGNLSTGVLKNIEGMKTKIMMRWSKLISVTMDSPEATKVVFVSSMNKSRPRDAYIVLRDGIEVGDF